MAAGQKACRRRDSGENQHSSAKGKASPGNNSCGGDKRKKPQSERSRRNKAPARLSIKARCDEDAEKGKGPTGKFSEQKYPSGKARKVRKKIGMRADRNYKSLPAP